MTLERIALLRNVGQFDSVDAGAKISLTKLSLIYAENGRGKTTIAAVLRSLGTGEPGLIEERRRLGSANAPHVVIAAAGKSMVFQNGAWGASLPQIAVFDDAFVAANVCSGVEIDTAHRQNLHELIIGAQGVALNEKLQGHVAKIEEHNRNLRTKADAISASLRGPFSVDDFCALAADPTIDTKIQEAERSLAAARAGDAIRQRADFKPVVLPGFDVEAIDKLLSRSLPDLEAKAAARVREHLRSLGRGGEAWVGEGMGRVAGASAGKGNEVCPFCAQDLAGSPLIQHYQAYFSAAYEELKASIKETGLGIASTHGGDVPAAFERAVRGAVESQVFWRTYTDVPDVDVDTAMIVRTWSAAREAVLAILRAKAAAPLEAMKLGREALEAISAYDAHRVATAKLSASLVARNAAIAIVKEKATAANVATLTADLAKLTAIRARHQAATAALCNAYRSEKESKTATEGLRDKARTALDEYRQQIFPAYESAINEYLRRFNAGFRLGRVSASNNRGGSTATYNVVINNVSVNLTSQSGPSFRNTLSAGDRNTLALAFFFASLDQDATLAQKIVLIDDPMTSLDEHRSLTTVQEMHRLCGRVTQMLVLSHSKPFLCAVWDGADKVTRSAMRIVRDGSGSSLAVWDVRQDCITEHDRRHELVRQYMKSGNPSNERAVAAALRPILEAFMRVAYPADFPPGSLLGPFIGICQQRHGQTNEILDVNDTNELRALLDYANKFHHDTNLAWETAAINDQELVDFANRTLAFTSKS